MIVICSFGFREAGFGVNVQFMWTPKRIVGRFLHPSSAGRTFCMYLLKQLSMKLNRVLCFL